MSVPNVNLFLGYVNNTRGLKENDKYRMMYGEKRKFYSSSKDNDYVKYVQTGSKESIETDYLEYSGNIEKSHGVFNQFGLIDEKSMKILRNHLRKTESVIWHGVISFTEEFGNKYCNCYEKAYEMMKKEMPKFFKSCNLNPKNIVWFAGLHENTDNKHIHFSFFEKSPERFRANSENLCYSDGLLPKESINRAKISIEMCLTGLREQVGENRKLVTEELKNNLEKGAYMKHLNSLVIILPREGRLQYDSENLRKYRPYIDHIANTIISKNEKLQQQFTRFQDILESRDNEMMKAYKRAKLDYSKQLIKDKCIEDIYRRLGNLILFSVKEIRKEQDSVEFIAKTKNQIKRIEKNKRKVLVRKCFELNDLVNQEIIDAFEEFQERLKSANFARLQEEGYFD